jgi:16S rRNA (uracil1498-N3)-methyltransferase
VSRIVPWQAERSISRWEGDKRTKGVARWASIAREAAKQAVRSRVPEVTEPITTKSLIHACAGSVVLVLDPRAELGIGDWARANNSARDIALVVGPEGGISDAEIDTLAEAGAIPVRVGDDIMRTSTAGPAAIAALRALLGQW